MEKVPKLGKAGKRALSIVLALSLLAGMVALSGINVGAAATPSTYGSIRKTPAPTYTFTAPETIWLEPNTASPWTTSRFQLFGSLNDGALSTSGYVNFTGSANDGDTGFELQSIVGDQGVGALPVTVGSRMANIDIAGYSLGAAIDQNALTTVTWTASFKLRNDPAGTVHTATATSRVWAPSMLGSASRYHMNRSGANSSEGFIGILGLHVLDSVSRTTADGNSNTPTSHESRYILPDYFVHLVNGTLRNDWWDNTYSTTTATAAPMTVPTYGHGSGGAQAGLGAIISDRSLNVVGGTLYVDTSRYTSLKALPNFWAQANSMFNLQGTQGLFNRPGWTTWADFSLDGGTTKHRLINLTNVWDSGDTYRHRTWNLKEDTDYAGLSVATGTITKKFWLQTHTHNDYVAPGEAEPIVQVTFDVIGYDKSAVRTNVRTASQVARVPQAYSDTGNAHSSATLESAISTAVTTLGNPKVDAAAYAGPTAANLVQKEYTAVAECFIQGSGDPLDHAAWGGGNTDTLTAKYSFGDSFLVEAPVIPGYELTQVVTNTLKGAGLTGPGQFVQKMMYTRVVDAYWEFYYKPIVEYDVSYDLDPDGLFEAWASGAAPAGTDWTGAYPPAKANATSQNPPTTAVIPDGSTFGRANYTFGGWTVSSILGDFTFAGGTDLADFLTYYATVAGGADYTPGTTSPAANPKITLRAVWNPVATYGVVYRPGHADAFPAYDVLDAGPYIPDADAIVLKGASTFTRLGYEIIGWSRTAGAAVADYEFTDTPLFPENPTTDCEFDINGNFILYPVWKSTAVTVTFDYNDGATSDTTRDYVPGSRYDMAIGGFPADPSRSGYTFLGWTKADSAVPGAALIEKNIDTVAAAHTVKAVWQKHIKVTFNTNGGTAVADELFYLPGSRYDASVGLAPFPAAIPTLAGYKFLGWSESDVAPGTAAALVNPSVTTVTNTSDHELYAVWQTLLKVDFDTQGGDAWAGDGLELEYVPGSRYDTTFDGTAFPAINPTKAGAAFVGWSSTDPDVSVTPVNPNTGTVDADTTLYAVWADHLTVSFDRQGGSPSSLDTLELEYLPGSRYDTPVSGAFPADPTKSGAVFAGWSTLDPDADYSAALAAIINKNAHGPTLAATTLYAVWTDYVVVSFDVNDGDTAPPASLNYVPNSRYNAPDGGAFPTTQPSRTGYDFLGWSTVKDDASTIIDKYENSVGTASHPLFAAWQKHAEVTFDDDYDSWANDGLVLSYAPGSRYSEPKTPGVFPDAVPVKEGFEFLGWSTTEGDESDIINKYVSTVAADTVLYPIWAVGKVTVTWNHNINPVETNNVIDTSVVDKGGTYTPVSTPTREGYKLMGWADEADKTLVIVSPAGGAPVALDQSSPQKLFAVWAKEKYAVTFDLQDAVYFNAGDDTYTGLIEFGATLADGVIAGFTAVPIRTDGKTFAGWFTDPGCTGFFWDGNSAMTMPDVGDDGDPVTYYAKWLTGDATITWNFYNDTVNPANSVTRISTIAYGAQFKDATPPPPDMPEEYIFPVRPGYKFLYWADLELGPPAEFPLTTISAPSQFTNDKLTLYAIWEKEQYTITFDYNDTLGMGGLGGAQTTVVTFDQDLHALSIAKPTPSAGYTFLGWAATPAGTVFWDPANGSFFTGDLTPGEEGDKTTPTVYYARWAVGGVVVNWNFNINAEEENNVIRVTERSKGTAYGTFMPADIKLPNYRPGYELLGWSKTRAGAVYLAPGDITTTIPMDEGTPQNLYAIWQKEVYTVTFDLNDPYFDGVDGRLEAAYSGSVEFEAALADGVIAGFVAVPTRTDGKTFAGWYLESACTTLFWDGVSAMAMPDPEAGTLLDTRTVTYYAKWNDGDAKIVWNFYNDTANDGANSATRQSTVTYGQAYTTSFPVRPVLPAAYQAPVRTGYVFQGWSATAGGAVLAEAFFDGPALPADFAGEALPHQRTFYAVWEKEEYAITFDYNYRPDMGAQPADGTATVNFDTNLSALGPAAPSAVPGFNFLGWAATDDGPVLWRPSDGPYYTGDLTPSDELLTGTAKTYFAVWDEGAVTVHWNYNINPDEPSNIIRTTTVTYGRTYGEGVPGGMPSDLTAEEYRPGYVFKGWAAARGGAAVAVDADGTQPVAITATTTYYAIWEALEYTVKVYYTGNADDFASGATLMHTYYNVQTGDIVEITDPPTPWGAFDYFQGFWAMDPWTSISPTLYTKDGGVWKYTLVPTVGVDEIKIYAVYNVTPLTLTLRPNEGIFPGAAERVESVVFNVYNGMQFDLTLRLPTRTGFNFVGWERVTADSGVFVPSVTGTVTIGRIVPVNYADLGREKYEVGNGNVILQAIWDPQKTDDPFTGDGQPPGTGDFEGKEPPDPKLPNGYDPEDPGTYPPPPATGDPDGPGGGWPDIGYPPGQVPPGEEILWPPHTPEGDPIDWPPVMPPEGPPVEYGQPYPEWALPPLGCFSEWHFLGYFEPTGRKVQAGDICLLNNLGTPEADRLSVVFSRKFSANYYGNGEGATVSASPLIVAYGERLGQTCNVISIKDKLEGAEGKIYATTHAEHFPTAARPGWLAQGWNTSAHGTGIRVNKDSVIGKDFNFEGTAHLLLLRDNDDVAAKIIAGLGAAPQSARLENAPANVPGAVQRSMTLEDVAGQTNVPVLSLYGVGLWEQWIRDPGEKPSWWPPSWWPSNWNISMPECNLQWPPSWWPSCKGCNWGDCKHFDWPSCKGRGLPNWWLPALGVGLPLFGMGGLNIDEIGALHTCVVVGVGVVGLLLMPFAFLLPSVFRPIRDLMPDWWPGVRDCTKDRKPFLEFLGDIFDNLFGNPYGYYYSSEA